MDIRCARELMIPIEKYPTVSADMKISEAIAQFLDGSHDIEADDGRRSVPRVLLVIGAGRELLGILRRRDIMRGLEPGFLRSEPQDSRKRIFPVRADPDLAELSYDRLLAPMKARVGRPITDVMQPIQVTVREDDHLFKIIDAMVDSNVSLVPVLKEGRVTGAVRSVDVLGEVSRIVQ